MNTAQKKTGQTGGRLRDRPEKADRRRDRGGAAQQGHHGNSDREKGNPHGFETAKTEPLEPLELRERKGNRERHADKQQPEEAGPGRASRTPPAAGRYQV
jgi:hypothetical protein